MNQGFDVIIKGGFLQVVGDLDGLFPVHVDVFEEVFSLNQLEAQLRNAFVQSIREFSSHDSQQPGKD